MQSARQSWRNCYRLVAPLSFTGAWLQAILRAINRKLQKLWQNSGLPLRRITVSFYRKNVSLGLLVCSKCRCRFIIHKEHYSTKTLRVDGKRLENGEKYVGIPLLEAMREIKLV